MMAIQMKNLRYLILTFFLSALTLTGCSSLSLKENKNKVSIMSYNVENLFDNQDDVGKNDETYFPLSVKKASPKIQKMCREIKVFTYRKQCLEMDWSDAVLDKKMERLADVVLQVNGGFGPDILILQEVENKRILEIFRKKYLKKAQYKEAVLLEGPDQRGIDVGILTRLPLHTQPKLHLVPWKKGTGRDGTDPRPSRGILEANFLLSDRTPLNVFGVHFPSQYNPYSLRRQALAELKRLVQRKPSHHINIAGGDFNIGLKEHQKYQVYSKILPKDWLVSHNIGCKKCKGTYYYHRGREWYFLDVFLFSKNLSPGKSSLKGKTMLSPWQVNPSSIRVVRGSLFQVNRFLTPARFEGGKGPRGVSDHWPIYAEIELRHPVMKVAD